MNANMRSRPGKYYIMSSGIFDGKHVDGMSDSAFRLYSWLIDNQNWDTGIVYGYTDDYAGGILHKSRQTIFKLRKELMDGNYITCTRESHGFEITICNAIDPTGEKEK